MLDILDVGEPVFTRVRYNFSDLTTTDSIKFILKNPPRLKLEQMFHVFLKDGTILVVPPQFITDGASVPRFIWPIPGFSPFGVLLEGGVLHDFAYQYGYLLAVYDPARRYPEESLLLRAQYSHVFNYDQVPIFIGKDHKFFDEVFKDVCIFTSGAQIVPTLAYKALWWKGDVVWDKYRTHGPGVFNHNSLGLPGLNHNGVIF